MPSIVITLTDTPGGGLSVHTDFVPAVGKPCSMAQAAALDILRRTRKEYNLPEHQVAVPPKSSRPAAGPGITYSADTRQ